MAYSGQVQSTEVSKGSRRGPPPTLLPQAVIMNSAGATLTPNPYTPMAFLPPSLAQEYEVTTLIYLTSTGALIWDWLMNMPDEYRIASLVGIPISKIAYFCARVFSLAFCLSSAMFQVAPVSDCQRLEVIMAIFIMFALNANNVLYFLRVRAVYGKSRIITAFFGFFGFGVFGTTFCAPFTIKAQHIGSTSRCVTTEVHPSLLAMMFSNATFGTLVFLAISYRITSQSVGGAGWCAAAKGFFRGDGAPRVGKLLLHHGQLSYL
ncbi:hypothetical protein FIBSPDRAFT_937892 [Athelia psychrophila]|uniref:Uncharacterized protein n=1 Tax=Athelia psychrophila TaxID=1759441 RepID=A0A165ZJP1_9AGAM|nr:hypothetical protein FIBSPDRAFT_937892 [Fibularhizoctonia sp. CBS 109695]